jgi:ribonuclease-3
MNLIKIPASDPAPVSIIRDTIGYEFINENLMRQAFTRRAFGIEYGVGNSEELEFLGDSILNMIVTREMARQFSEVVAIEPQAPFRSRYSEGEMTKIRSRFVNKEYLASRAVMLGLDKYILYGTDEQETDSAAEDMMEALLGAVAVDCGWDWHVLEEVADRLVCIQITKPDEFLKSSYYDLFNAWHQRHFGCIPDYEIYSERSQKSNPYHCSIRFSIPQNQKGLMSFQRIDVDERTRGRAREHAAWLAYCFVMDNGLWLNLSDAAWCLLLRTVLISSRNCIRRNIWSISRSIHLKKGREMSGDANASAEESTDSERPDPRLQQKRRRLSWYWCGC